MDNQNKPNFWLGIWDLAIPVLLVGVVIAATWICINASFSAVSKTAPKVTPSSSSVGLFSLGHDWSYTLQHKAGSEDATIGEYTEVKSGTILHKVYAPGALTFRIYSLSDANNANCTNCGIVLCK